MKKTGDAQLQWAYALALKILVEEFIQLFLLEWGKRVDLGAEVVGIWNKFNGVVPLLPNWNLSKDSL